MTLTRRGPLNLVLAALCAITVACVLLIDRPLAFRAVAALLALAIYVGIAVVLRRMLDRDERIVLAIADGLASLRESDYSMSVSAPRDSAAVQRLASAYNGLGDRLRAQRQDIYQRELLLDTVIQATPLALVLTNANGAVIYANLAARHLFNAGAKLEGLSFDRVLDRCPAALRAALAEERDALFTVEHDGEPQIYHLSQRSFSLNGQPHRLRLVKQLTREFNAREVATWKRVIRVIAHEINNSVAPIASLAQSGQRLAEHPDSAQLTRVFGAIEERMAHLAGFVDGYSRFAKLPRPRLETVDWPGFIERLRPMAPFVVEGSLPTTPGWFDASQMQQVLLNLVKNAQEAGSPPDEVRIAIERRGESWQIEVRDRGSGMSDEVLANALVPFYSTKATGTGLGLTLCREIVEAHNGTFEVSNRVDGGILVRIRLPAPTHVDTAH
jgi:nitrogen fixation/metabolism regulation signal transduction histidine kinase